MNVNSPIKAFKKVLVGKISAQPEVPEDSWPPVSNNTYINLALIKQGSINKAGEYARNTIQGNVDDIISDKECIEYTDAFTGLESGTRLLVEGRPGSGKTTLVHKFSRDWAVNTCDFNLKNIMLLFLVHLRGFFNDSSIELRDIVQKYYTDDTNVDTIVQHADKNGGEGLCFVLDGLDEYSPSNKNNTFIFRLIKKQVLPKSIVIVASRPAASARLRKVATKQIEVIGFLKAQIFEYVNFHKQFALLIIRSLVSTNILNDILMSTTCASCLFMLPWSAISMTSWGMSFPVLKLKCTQSLPDTHCSVLLAVKETTQIRI